MKRPYSQKTGTVDAARIMGDDRRDKRIKHIILGEARRYWRRQTIMIGIFDGIMVNRDAIDVVVFTGAGRKRFYITGSEAMEVGPSWAGWRALIKAKVAQAAKGA